MNASTSYFDTKNKLKQIAEGKYETDNNKQKKDILNSDNNPNKDINAKDIKKINKNYLYYQFFLHFCFFSFSHF